VYDRGWGASLVFGLFGPHVVAGVGPVRRLWGVLEQQLGDANGCSKGLNGWRVKINNYANTTKPLPSYR